MKSILKFILVVLIASLVQNNLLAENTLKGMQLGIEDAPLTVIEYRSLRCGHCADFHKNILPLLKEKYIDTGKIKLEVRPYPLDAIDFRAFKLLHCAKENDFFALEKTLFTNQEKWFITQPAGKEIENSLEALAKFGMLFDINQDEYNNCLNDKEMENFIISNLDEAINKYRVSSTPTFIINDKTYSGNQTFDTLESIILKELDKI